MANYVNWDKSDDTISITFYIEEDKPLEIGEKMAEINENACMNGYNWEALLNYYLDKNDPDILVGLETDSEAGMYTAYYDVTPENEAKAKRFCKIITHLIENEDELYSLVRDEGDDIEWD